MTEFAIERTGDGPPVLFCCTGELDMATAPRLREALEPIDGDVLVDLTDLTFLDSSGVGALVAQRQRLAEHGSRLRLFGLQAPVRRTLEILGLADEFTGDDRVDPESP